MKEIKNIKIDINKNFTSVITEYSRSTNNFNLNKERLRRIKELEKKENKNNYEIEVLNGLKKQVSEIMKDQNENYL